MEINYDYINELKNVLDKNKDKRVCVLGTSCTGKTTYLNYAKNGLDMDKIIFPLLSEEEKEYVCQIGATMERLVKEKIKIEPGIPVFGTVIIDCDLIVYLDIEDSLLRERTKARNVNFTDVKNMKDGIEKELKETNIPVVRVAVRDREEER